MKSEDTRNLFLAIALSVLVMAAWQYFYAGPLYQREHQAQMQANQTQANTSQPASEAQPGATASGSAGQPGVSAPRGASAPGAAATHTVARGPCRERAGRYRHAERRRLDQPQGRQDRRYHSQRLSRDDRPEESEHPGVLAVRRARTPIGPRPAMSGRGSAKTPTLDTLWSANVKTLTTAQPVTLTWDNGAGLIFKPRHLSRRQVHVYDHRFDREQGRRARRPCRPLGLDPARGKPNVAGYSVLHEGFVGVVGDSRSAGSHLSLVREGSFTATKVRANRYE